MMEARGSESEEEEWGDGGGEGLLILVVKWDGLGDVEGEDEERRRC